jgi:hypothetical protein
MGGKEREEPMIEIENILTWKMRRNMRERND